VRKTGLGEVSIGLLALILFVSVISVQASAEEEFNHLASLQSPEPGSDAQFGYSVAVSGDIVVVGEIRGKVKDGVAGRAHIYNSDGNLLATVQAPERASIPTTSFSWSVDVSGDTVVVGEWSCYFENVEWVGIAYIFDSYGNLKSTLQTPEPQKQGLFGWSVAVSGDIVVVGEMNAKVEDVLGAGMVYIFDSYGNLQLTLQSPEVKFDQYFGSSVAVGEDKIVVGAVPSKEWTTPIGPGSVYIFNSEGNLLTTLQSPEPDNINFGWSVAISGDILVVGESFAEVDGKSKAGRAYIFDTDGNLLTTLQAPAPEENAEFGIAVDLCGDIVVVGEYKADVEVMNEGRAYVFDLDGNLLATLHSPTPGVAASFGYSVATNGEIVVVGEHYAEVDGEIKAGRVHIFQAGAAAFTSSGLTIDPSKVDVGGKVTISVEVANAGGKSGTHTVALKVDGEVEDEKTVTLNPDETKTVSFEVLASQLGTFSVEIDGLSGSYTVSEPEKKKPGIVIPGFPHESMIIGLAIGAVMLWLIQRNQ